MLESRVLSTLKLFDLQEVPLTLLELHKFLLAEPENLLEMSDEKYELKIREFSNREEVVSISEIQEALEILLGLGKVENYQGYYVLPGKINLISQRLRSYTNGIFRERRISRYLPFAYHIPFIQSIAVGGSQALGVEREGSDIDLLVITKPGYIWTARTLLTLYFQIFGVRRYSNFIADRFCLNHYIAGSKQLTKDRNLYTAMEYGRLRLVIGADALEEFKLKNESWVSFVFPNINEYQALLAPAEKTPIIRKFLEWGIIKFFGNSLENWLSNWQLRRIKRDDLIFVGPDELSFHHVGKQKRLLAEFYDYLNTLSQPKFEPLTIVQETIFIE